MDLSMFDMPSLVLRVGTEPTQPTKTESTRYRCQFMELYQWVTDRACWCRRFPNRSYNDEKSYIPPILLGQPGNDCTEHKLLLLSSRDNPGVSRWALTEKVAIKQNKTTSSLVGLSPQAVSVVIRPFIPLCMMTHQEKPSLSMLNFIPNLALAGHFFKALVSIVTQKWVLFLVPKEMRPNVQYGFSY